MYFIPDEDLWNEVKTTLKPIKRRVKKEMPKRLRAVRRTPSISDFLDLHGLTVQEAFDKSSTFIQKARKIGLKEITIVTGRGTTGKALIKNEFEGWLGTPKFASNIRTYQWQNKGGAVKVSLKKKAKQEK